MSLFERRRVQARAQNLPDWDGFGGRGMASGAAVLLTSYGAPGNEGAPPMAARSAGEAYAGNAIVFGAILARMSLFSEATFAFQDRATKALTSGFDAHGNSSAASLRKLETPWPNSTTGELLSRMLLDADLAGNAYVWDAGSQLVRLRPDWVTIISEVRSDASGREYRMPVGYWYEPPMSANQPPAAFTVDEVAHWSPTPEQGSNFLGRSWITPVLREIQADSAMTDHKINYLENAASPNLLIRYAQKLRDETVGAIADRVTAQHSGSRAFRTLVLDQGADVTVIGNSLEQMNFSTVQAAGENRILIASGVPGIVIGSKEGLMAATYSNYEQAMRRFADLTMRPLWRSVCGALAKLVSVPSGSRLWYDVADIAALRQGEKELADTMFVKMQAIGEAIKFGADPDSAIAAVQAGQVGQLEYKGPPIDILAAVPKAAPPAIPLPDPNGAAPALPAANGNANGNGGQS